MRRSGLSRLRGRKGSSFLGYVQILLGRPFLLFGGISLLLLFLSFLHVQPFSQGRIVVWSVLSPALSAISKPFVALGSFAGNVTSYQQLQADNALLQDENERLNEWYHTAQLLKAENQSLKSLLNVQSLSTYEFITARIMVDPSTPYAQTILLDAGEGDGVSVGQAVVGKSGLLGRVIDVQDSVSRVLLVTDINSRIPVLIEGTSQRAVASGQNLGLPMLEYIPEVVTLEVGMPIVTSGDGGVLPMGIPLGTIQSIEGGRILVMPATDYDASHFVRILKKVE